MVELIDEAERLAPELGADALGEMRYGFAVDEDLALGRFFEQARNMQQRGFARARLADEPTGNLDPRTADGVFEVLISLVRSENLSALIATHNYALSDKMDRTLQLDKGALIESTAPRKSAVSS